MPKIEFGTRGVLLLVVLLLLEGVLIFLIGWHFGGQLANRSEARSNDGQELATPALNTPPGTNADAPAAGAPSKPQRFAVQVGSFVVEEELQAFLTTLEARGWPVYVARSFNSAGNSLFEVRLGPFDTRQEAEGWVESSTDAAHSEPWVVRAAPAEEVVDPAPAEPATSSP